MKRTVILPKWIVPIRPQNTVLEDTAIVLNEGRIEALIPKDTILPDDEVTHLPHHAIMPGFVNAHCHSPMVLLRGFGSDLPLAKWLENHMWKAENALMSKSFVADGTRLAIAEMLLSGTTCFSEHYFHPEVACDVARDMSVRALVGLWLGHVATPWSQNIDECFDKNLAYLQDHQDSDSLRIAWAPHSIYLVPHKDLIRLQKELEQDPRAMHIHCHETQKELAESLTNHGMRPISFLDKLGLLNEHTMAVHMIDATAEEAALIRKRGANVVTCPNSNLKLASGFCPTPLFLEHGVNIAVGTDGAASNNALDLLQEARKACYLTKALGSDTTLMPAHQMLEMLTLNGAKALGFDHIIGTIEAGKGADMVAFDLSHFTCYPQHDIQAMLAYACPSQRISHVWTQGVLQVENGELCQENPDDLRHLAIKWQKQTKAFS